jgi:outer membrane protein assembly factor BamB
MSHFIAPFLCALALASVALAKSPPPASQSEWPEFRGPSGAGNSSATKVPVEWNESTNIAWKIDLPGRGWSSPIVSRGRVYLTTAISGADGAEPTLHALCIDAANGRTIWDSAVFRPDAAGFAQMHQKNSPASPTPIVTRDRLFVHFGHLGTAALDLAGNVVWKQDAVKFTPVHGNGGSPVLEGGALVFSCDGAQEPFLAALDAATGELRWKAPRNSPAKKQFSFSTPLAIEVAGQRQIISPASGFVGGYDPKDGREIWRVTYGEGYSVVPRPIFTHGLLVLGSGFDAPVLYAIRPDSAAGDATATNVAWTIRKGAPLTPSALALGDAVYFVSDAGIATCADARSGQVHWSERLGGNFSASPVAAEGRIYFLNESGVTFVVKAAPTYELLATNELHERALASPAVIDGALFLRTEKRLWKIAGTKSLPPP